MITYALLLLLLANLCSCLLPQATIATNVLSEYASHWEGLLLAEYQETEAELRERRKRWSQRRLEHSGMSIFGARAEPDSDILGEKIVRIVKRGEQYFRDRFTKGDVLLMTPLVAGVDPIPRECLVVDVGEDWLTVGVGPSWPKGLYEARKHPGAYIIRMDRAAPAGPLRFQRMAFEQLRKGEAGSAADLLVHLFYNKNNTQDLASELPPRLDCNLDMEQVLRKALDEATNITSLVPNQSQKHAIAWALKRRISLIRGPPGTGKTRTAALLVSTALQLQQQVNEISTQPHAKARVLAVAHSNGAADVLLEALLQMGVPAVRLGRPAAVSPSVRHRTIVAMSEKMPEVIRLRQTMNDTSLDIQIRSSAAFEIKQSLQDVQRMIIDSAPVVVTTCIGSHQLFGGASKDIKFPIVVLDEAAQTTEPALICALAASKADQLVLVGDTRQLPPTVTSMKLRDSLGISPMARLEKDGVDETTLRVQYRMSPGLLEHPSTYFYKGRITCAEDLSDRNLDPPAGFPWPKDQPLAFVQSGNGNSEVAHNFGGRSNPTEAKLVARIVSNLLAAGEVDDSEIAVISPYSKQVQLIRTELASFDATKVSKKAQNVRVGTVDSFQGQEKEVIIFSAVRSNPLSELGFLRDARRLCVAITRAKRGLILVGDKASLRSCRHWSALLEHCEKRECIVEGIESLSDVPSAADDISQRKQNFEDMQTDAMIESIGGGDEYGLF
jgi:superfamily I DNA and/or RNA helicase